MNWEPDPDLGEPIAGVRLERRQYSGEIYDYRVVVKNQITGTELVVAESRDGRLSIGAPYHAARHTAEFLGNPKGL